MLGAELTASTRPRRWYCLPSSVAHQCRIAGFYGFIDCFLAIRVRYACVLAEMLHMQVRETP